MIKSYMTSYDERLQNIYILNISYLLLAQRLIKQDRFTASFSSGIDDDLISIIKDLTLSQINRLASTDRLICQLRIDEVPVLNAITKNSRLEALQGIHAGIVLSTNLINSLEEKGVASPPVSDMSGEIDSFEQICTV